MGTGGEVSSGTDISEPFNCTACGACCSYAGKVIVDRLDTVPDHLTQPAHDPADDRVFMARESEGRCIALQGEIGLSCRCSIYDHRPAACRDFEPGSIACRGARSVVFK